MGRDAKKVKGSNKSLGAVVPMRCPACHKWVNLSLTLATEHINACKRNEALKGKAQRKAEALRMQGLADAQAGRREDND